MPSPRMGTQPCLTRFRSQPASLFVYCGPICPASSLVQMGLDLDSDAAEAIPVDLVIGEDDLPRAVRIVGNDF